MQQVKQTLFSPTEEAVTRRIPQGPNLQLEIMLAEARVWREAAQTNNNTWFESCAAFPTTSLKVATGISSVRAPFVRRGPARITERTSFF